MLADERLVWGADLIRQARMKKSLESLVQEKAVECLCWPRKGVVYVCPAVKGSVLL